MYQNVADVSGYGKHGYLNGQTSTTTAIGKLGQALEFDGVNDYVSVGSVYNGVKTISFWLRTDQSYSKKIIDIDATDQIELNGSSNIVATSFPSPTVYVDGTVASAIATSTWHFITITDSTGVNVSAMDIGRVSAGYFDGQIDDIRMYSSVLSASEIGQLYRTGSVKFRQ